MTRVWQAQASSLHAEPEIISWLPPDTELGELAKALEAEPTAIEERKKEIAIVLSTTFATKPIRALYATRLWRMGEFFDGTARLPQGQVARAEARRLLHTDEPSGFLGQLFAKVPAAASS